MKKQTGVFFSVFIFALYLSACHSTAPADQNRIWADTASVAAGGVAFHQYCGGCHNFRQDGIGPQLGGITTEVSAGWIKHFVRDPQQTISSGDQRAEKLFKHFKVVMPAFSSLKENELNQILAYLNVHKHSAQHTAKEYGQAIANPIPRKIEHSDLAMRLRLITQFPASVDSGKHPMARITKMDFERRSGSSYILDLRGKLYKLQKNNQPAVYMDMARLMPRFIAEPGLATGFGSFAFHPDFAKNGLLYTTHTEGPGSARADFGYGDSIKVTLQWVVTEWKTDHPEAGTFSGKGRELFRVNMVTGMHGVQDITFNPLAKAGDADYGLLYIGVGDGGCVEEGYPFLANNPEDIWGTVLRIDPLGRNSANGQYGIPAGNPFAQNKGKNRGEVYAYGFRNPHRITWTRSGDMLVCNVGMSNIESINLIKPGRDYGWPIREGNFRLDTYGDLNKVYPLPADDSVYRITYPVAAFDHDEGNAICGGYEYWGEAVPQLKGKFLFGDIPNGRLFYVETADLKQGHLATIHEWKIIVGGTPRSFREILGKGRVDLHFGRDTRGELYLMTKEDGKLYQII
jgi:glucose/arabinose dehydrogenase/mono/diheme cytochrome c family protein